jgi:hypothetical protein
MVSNTKRGFALRRKATTTVTVQPCKILSETFVPSGNGLDVLKEIAVYAL